MGRRRLGFAACAGQQGDAGDLASLYLVKTAADKLVKTIVVERLSVELSKFEM